MGACYLNPSRWEEGVSESLKHSILCPLGDFPPEGNETASPGPSPQHKESPVV